MNQEKYLKNRVAFVTGGASGMGKAMALAFAKAGSDVVIGSLVSTHNQQNSEELVYLPSFEELENTKKEIENLGVRAISTNLDVCSMESIQTLYDLTIKTFGKVDILANAAGISAEQTICNHNDQLWHKIIDVNLNGTYRTIKLCLPGMIKQGWGRIINIASTAASIGSPTNGAYSASKAGVLGLTRCVALEGAAHGVSCNAISPGWVETNFGKNWMTHIAESIEGKNSEQYIQETKQTNPQQRIIQPKEIGALAAFLCREEAFGITMQDITVSAGSLW